MKTKNKGIYFVFIALIIMLASLFLFQLSEFLDLKQEFSELEQERNLLVDLTIYDYKLSPIEVGSHLKTEVI